MALGLHQLYSMVFLKRSGRQLYFRISGDFARVSYSGEPLRSGKGDVGYSALERVFNGICTVFSYDWCLKML